MAQRAGTADLVGALGLGRSPGLISIVGGGGKSSLLFALAGALPGRVVATTTTRIFAAQMKLADEVCTLDDAGWEAKLDTFDDCLLVVGSVDGDRATGVPADLPGRLLARPSVDWVVVEADGSRMRPVKAPADHEPVVPEETTLLIPVVGIDALAAPIHDVAHRPERVCAITGRAPDQTLDEEALASLLTSERGGLKNAPDGASVSVLVNKVESPAQWESARRIAHLVARAPGVDRVACGALQGAADESWEFWTD